MEQNFDTSFIPKRPIFKEEASVRRHEPIPVVTLFGFAIFFAALIITGVVFYFSQKEAKAVESLATELATEKERFNPQAIEELKAVSVRLKFAKDVVDNHVAASPLLDLIQDVTIKSVYYTGFDLKREEKTGYSLRLQGKAPSYGMLYAQMQAYRAEPKIRSVEIGTNQLDERSGEATFEVTLVLSPEVMKYIPKVVATPEVPAPIESADATTTAP
jgi:hypothetical protein